VNGYLISSQAASKAPLPPQAELAWWYQFYFATDRGQAGCGRYRREFSELIWRLASPKRTLDPDHPRRRLVRAAMSSLASAPKTVKPRIWSMTCPPPYLRPAGVRRGYDLDVR
jgi:hypothetical protein